MDYDKLFNATYEWISLRSAVWYLVFFWIAIPVLVFVPQLVSAALFSITVTPVVWLLYTILYISVIVGLLALTQYCLDMKNLSAHPFSFTRFADTIFLVFVELWYLFVWNLHRAYRITQLLVIVGLLLSLYMTLTSNDMVSFVSLLIFVFIYSLLIIYNFCRLCFTLVVFTNTETALRQAPKESWAITHKKFWDIFTALVLIVGSLFVLFAFISIVLGAVANMILINFFTARIAYSVSLQIATLFAIAPVLIGYYFAIVEIYSQLKKEHNSTSRLNHMLERKVFAAGKKKVSHPSAPSAKRKLARKGKKGRK